ncbi:homocysteine S-methyltransferase family protein [Candidatus Riflebacteria bacterium]
MNPILARLANGEILVADGAMGTMLFQKGLKPGDCPELFNLTKPEILEEIAGTYLDAGADIIQTNTFGGSPAKLSGYSLEEKAVEINQAAVRSVKKAVGGRAYISGSCGPSGKILKPYGDTEPELLYDSFKIQMEALINAGVDMLCIETMIDLNEALIALRAARSISREIPVAVTMSFDKTPKGFYTMMGVSIRDAVSGLEEAGASMIGSNCGNGLQVMIEIAGEFKKLATLPVIIQSNAGLPESINDKLVYSEDPEFFAINTRELVNGGISIIGGCCGTTPEHIQAIRKVVG